MFDQFESNFYMIQSADMLRDKFELATQISLIADVLI